MQACFQQVMTPYWSNWRDVDTLPWLPVHEHDASTVMTYKSGCQITLHYLQSKAKHQKVHTEKWVWQFGVCWRMDKFSDQNNKLWTPKWLLLILRGPPTGFRERAMLVPTSSTLVKTSNMAFDVLTTVFWSVSCAVLFSVFTIFTPM